jgi:O-antigen/teichoic acid export membrane protein
VDALFSFSYAIFDGRAKQSRFCSRSLVDPIGEFVMIRKNYFYTVALSVTNILFPLLSFPYVSRILGPHGIGKIQLAVSFAQYFAFFAALGIPAYGIQEIAKARDNKAKLDRVFSELVMIYFITSLLFSAIYLAVIFSIPYFGPNLEVYGYASLIILLGFSSIDWFYAGIEDFKTMALRSIAVKLLSLVLLYFFVRDISDFRNYLFVTVFALIGNNLINFIIIGRKTVFVFPGKQATRHLTPLLYIFSTTVAASMYSVLDTVLLGFMTDEKAVGLYSAAIKISKVSIPLITSAGLILIPQVSKKMEEGNHAEVQSVLDNAFRFFAFFSIPIMMGMLVLSRECILVFSGSQFAEAVSSMQVVSVLPVLIGFGFYATSLVLIPGGRHKQMLISVFTGLVLSIILNILLVPHYRYFGASVTIIATELLVTALYFYYAKKYFNYTYEWGSLFSGLLCALPFILIVYLTRKMDLSPVVTLLLSVPLCGVAYFTLQYLLFKDPLVLKVINVVFARIGLRQLRK